MSCFGADYTRRMLEEKDLTIKTLNEEWKSRCDYLEEEAERMLHEYKKLRAAVQPMMEEAARCNEEVAALRACGYINDEMKTAGYVLAIRLLQSEIVLDDTERTAVEFFFPANSE